MSDDSKIEQKALACPICQSNKAMIAGENVKLGGKFEDKEFLTTELTVLKCTKCGYSATKESKENEEPCDWMPKGAPKA